MTDLHIRFANEEDLEAIYRLNQTWKEMSLAYIMEQKFGQIGPRPAAVQKAEWLHRTLSKKLDRVIVAELEGQVVGYASFSLDRERKVGTVEDNAVDPDYRGRGIGTALQTRIKEIFKQEGMEYAMVTTMEHDHPARRVYEKVGFEEIARSIHYVMRL